MIIFSGTTNTTAHLGVIYFIGSHLHVHSAAVRWSGFTRHSIRQQCKSEMNECPRTRNPEKCKPGLADNATMVTTISPPESCQLSLRYQKSRLVFDTAMHWQTLRAVHIRLQVCRSLSMLFYSSSLLALRRRGRPKISMDWRRRM